MKIPSFYRAMTVLTLAIGTASLWAGAPSDNVVGIVATVAETAEPAPNIRVIPGRFTVSRRGDLTRELPVWLDYSGTATSGKDYRELPQSLSFAPGQSKIEFLVQAIDDEEREEDETLIARVYDPTLGPVPLFEVDPEHASATVTIHDSDGPFEDTVVSIKATRPIAEETAAPLRRINLVGEFTISRTGPTSHAQPLWLHLSGTATPARDYEALPFGASIPAGERSVAIPVTAIFDRVPEGIETVIATVSNCPPDTDPPLGAPCYGFKIDPTSSTATVFIREDGLTVATVHITEPSSGDHFALREPISIQAVAIHLESYLSRVEFWAGEERIGVSEIVFVRAPDPGTPITHQFTWENAPAGTHVLTARSERIVSHPVRITVGEAPPNLEPAATILFPASGAEFPAGRIIPIRVEARDPDGYLPKIEFFADGLKIGEQNINFFVEPPPGQTQSFSFEWEHAMPGPHILSVRVTDNHGAGANSPEVEIFVIAGDARPVVTVVARDALAIEPGIDGTANAATFRIYRHGSTHGGLTVSYSLSGLAENGVDYQLLPGTAVIPDGLSSIDVTVVPLADQEDERAETVILTLEDGDYRREFPSRANAVIRERPMPNPEQPACLRLADRHVHLCFPARSGVCIRVEASSTLRDWTTLFCVIAVDGTVHIVQETTPDVPHRFFRVSEEPNRPADE